jgi:hypothetical protein
MSTALSSTLSVVQLYSEAIETIARCSQMFIHALEEGRIQAGPEAVTAGLTTIHKLTKQAARLNETGQMAIFQHWIDHGPALCQRLISEAERKSPPILTVEMFTDPIGGDKPPASTPA